MLHTSDFDIPSRLLQLPADRGSEQEGDAAHVLSSSPTAVTPVAEVPPPTLIPPARQAQEPSETRASSHQPPLSPLPLLQPEDEESSQARMQNGAQADAEGEAERPHADTSVPELSELEEQDDVFNPTPIEPFHSKHAASRPSTPDFVSSDAEATPETNGPAPGPGGVAVELRPLTDTLVMFGPTATTVRYSLGGHIVVRLPKAPPEVEEEAQEVVQPEPPPPPPDYSSPPQSPTLSPVKLADSAKPPGKYLHIQSIRVLFAGYSCYYDLVGRFGGLKLADNDEELIPKPVAVALPSANSSEGPDDPASAYEIEFDLSVPGALPQSYRTAFGATFYTLDAVVQYAFSNSPDSIPPAPKVVQTTTAHISSIPDRPPASRSSLASGSGSGRAETPMANHTPPQCPTPTIPRPHELSPQRRNTTLSPAAMLGALNGGPYWASGSRFHLGLGPEDSREATSPGKGKKPSNWLSRLGRRKSVFPHQGLGLGSGGTSQSRLPLSHNREGSDPLSESNVPLVPGQLGAMGRAHGSASDLLTTREGSGTLGAPSHAAWNRRSAQASSSRQRPTDEDVPLGQLVAPGARRGAPPLAPLDIPGATASLLPPLPDSSQTDAGSSTNGTIEYPSSGLVSLALGMVVRFHACTRVILVKRSREILPVPVARLANADIGAIPMDPPPQSADEEPDNGEDREEEDPVPRNESPLPPLPSEEEDARDEEREAERAEPHTPLANERSDPLTAPLVPETPLTPVTPASAAGFHTPTRLAPALSSPLGAPFVTPTASPTTATREVDNPAEQDNSAEDPDDDVPLGQLHAHAPSATTAPAIAAAAAPATPPTEAQPPAQPPAPLPPAGDLGALLNQPVPSSDKHRESVSAAGEALGTSSRAAASTSESRRNGRSTRGGAAGGTGTTSSSPDGVPMRHFLHRPVLKPPREVLEPNAIDPTTGMPLVPGQTSSLPFMLTVSVPTHVNTYKPARSGDAPDATRANPLQFIVQVDVNRQQRASDVWRMARARGGLRLQRMDITCAQSERHTNLPSRTFCFNFPLPPHSDLTVTDMPTDDLARAEAEAILHRGGAASTLYDRLLAKGFSAEVVDRVIAEQASGANQRRLQENANITRSFVVGPPTTTRSDDRQRRPGGTNPPPVPAKDRSTSMPLPSALGVNAASSSSATAGAAAALGAPVPPRSASASTSYSGPPPPLPLLDVPVAPASSSEPPAERPHRRSTLFGANFGRRRSPPRTPRRGDTSPALCPPRTLAESSPSPTPAAGANESVSPSRLRSKSMWNRLNPLHAASLGGADEEAGSSSGPANSGGPHWQDPRAASSASKSPAKPGRTRSRDPPRAIYLFGGEDGHGVDVARGRMRMGISLPLIASRESVREEDNLAMARRINPSANDPDIVAPLLMADFEGPFARVRHKLSVKLIFGFPPAPVKGGLAPPEWSQSLVASVPIRFTDPLPNELRKHFEPTLLPHHISPQTTLGPDSEQSDVPVAPILPAYTQLFREDGSRLADEGEDLPRYPGPPGAAPTMSATSSRTAPAVPAPPLPLVTPPEGDAEDGGLAVAFHDALDDADDGHLLDERVDVDQDLMDEADNVERARDREDHELGMSDLNQDAAEAGEPPSAGW